MLQVWSVGCRAVCHQCGRPVSVTSYFIKLFEGLVHHCQSASKRCLRCFPFVEKKVGHYLRTFLVVRLRLKVVLSPVHGSFRGPSSVDPQTSGLPILRICNNKKNCSNTSSRNLSDCDSPDSMRSSNTCHATCVSVWAPTRDTLENIFIMCSNSGPAPLVPHGTFRSCNTQLRVLFLLREDNPKCLHQATREKESFDTSCNLHSFLRLPHGVCKTENQPHTSAKESVRDPHAICTSTSLDLAQIECRRVASCPPSTAFGQTFPQLGLSILSCTPD